MVVQGNSASAFSEGSPGSEITLYNAEQRDENHRASGRAEQTKGGRDESSSMPSSRNFVSGASDEEPTTRIDKTRATGRVSPNCPALDARAILQSSLRSASARNENLCSDVLHILATTLRPATPLGKVMDAVRDVGLEVETQPTLLRRRTWAGPSRRSPSKMPAVRQATVSDHQKEKNELSECPDAAKATADCKRNSGLATLRKSCSQANQLQCRSVEGVMFYACLGRGKY